MSFTYNITTDRGQVRFEIGDVTYENGPRPADGSASNFADDEVDYWLTAEDSHVMRAVAAACETLARQWAQQPDTRLGPHGESASQIAKAYKDRADELRARYGHGNTTGGYAFAVGTAPTNPAAGTEYSA